MHGHPVQSTQESLVDLHNEEMSQRPGQRLQSNCKKAGTEPKNVIFLQLLQSTLVMLGMFVSVVMSSQWLQFRWVRAGKLATEVMFLHLLQQSTERQYMVKVYFFMKVLGNHDVGLTCSSAKSAQLIWTEG